MQTKLGDACAYAKKLRQTKNILRNKVLQKYCDRQEGKKVVADLVNKYRVLKMDCMAKSERKIQLYKEKNELQKSIKVAPANTSEILDGVKFFRQTKIM